MDNGVIFKIAKDNQNMTTVDRLVNIYHLLSQVLEFQVEGDVVELGCNAGKTSVFLQMVINHYSSNRKLHLYDSFQGLPPRGQYDKYLNEGDCKASIEEVEKNFNQWNLPSPNIHAGWFQDTLQNQLPEKISFAYLDSDFYDPILLSLEAVYPRLTRGAIVVIDDYCDIEKSPLAWNGLPGVKLACDEFFKTKTEKPSVLVGTSDLAMCYFRKR